MKFEDLYVILQHGHDDIYPHHIFIDDEMNPPFPINIKDLISQCWSQNPKERPSFDENYEKLSTDFSYSEETVDEDEVREYIEKLEEARRDNLNNQTEHVQLSDELKKLQIQLTQKEEEKRMIQTELIQLRSQLLNLQKQLNESNDHRKSSSDSSQKVQDDFTTVLNLIHGNKQERNMKKAVTKLKKSADEGSSYASYLLGLLYENGEGVPQNIDDAFSFYLKSSEQGNSNGHGSVIVTRTDLALSKTTSKRTNIMRKDQTETAPHR